MTGALERFLRQQLRDLAIVEPGFRAAWGFGPPNVPAWIRAYFGPEFKVDPWQVRLLEERLRDVRVAQAGWDEAGIRERYSRGRP